VAYKEIAGNQNRGPIYKWQTVGQSLEGVYLGTREGATFDGGRRSKLGVIVLETGVQTAFALPTALAMRVADLAPGSQVRITYTGTQKGNQPMPFKTFKVEVDDGSDGMGAVPAPASRHGASAGATGAPVGPADLADLKAALTAKLGRSAKAMLGAMEKQADGDDQKLGAMIHATLTQLGA
jgi:hypothetical protein